jgi:hypothetical protein
MFEWSFLEKLGHLNSEPFESRPSEADYKDRRDFVRTVFCSLITSPEFKCPFEFQTGNQNALSRLDNLSGIGMARPLDYWNLLCPVIKGFWYSNVRLLNFPLY